MDAKLVNTHSEKGVCKVSDCAAENLFVKAKFPAECAKAACTPAECCDDKTCANGGPDRKAVTCGSAFIAKASSTKCTTCANDGTECCDPKDKCEAKDCEAKSKVTKENFAKIMCSGKTCTESECCDDATCGTGGVDRKTVVCSSQFVRKPDNTQCKTCAEDGTECCEPKDKCDDNDCKADSTKVLKQNFAGITCSSKTCTESECCDDKTCGNKDGKKNGVKCGSAFTAKDGSTKCTDCADDGTECCTRTFSACLFLTLFLPAVFCH